MVLLEGKPDYLDIQDQGILSIPDGLKPSGFNLVLLVPDERFVIVQKNVGHKGGAYHQYALSQNTNNGNGVQTWILYDPIQVMRVGGNVWTAWHQQKPNRVDVWRLEKDGLLELVQVGIITHDDGTTFRILGEPRWRGKLFRSNGLGYVGKPENQKWGPLSPKGTRDGIFGNAEFQRLCDTATIPEWNGSNDELEIPLLPVPGPGLARVEWYIPFAGQTGQGIAILQDGSPAWVHGANIQKDPDPDGIKRLWRNDLISYTGMPEKWGTKKGSPPKIVGVRLT